MSKEKIFTVKHFPIEFSNVCDDTDVLQTSETFEHGKFNVQIARHKKGKKGRWRYRLNIYYLSE